MSDQEFGNAVAEIRAAIHSIREDVTRLETIVEERAKCRWYNHLPFFSKV